MPVNTYHWPVNASHQSIYSRHPARQIFNFFAMLGSTLQSYKSPRRTGSDRCPNRLVFVGLVAWVVAKSSVETPGVSEVFNTCGEETLIRLAPGFFVLWTVDGFSGVFDQIHFWDSVTLEVFKRISIITTNGRHLSPVRTGSEVCWDNLK